MVRLKHSTARTLPVGLAVPNVYQIRDLQNRNDKAPKLDEYLKTYSHSWRLDSYPDIPRYRPISSRNVKYRNMIKFIAPFCWVVSPSTYPKKEIWMVWIVQQNHRASASYNQVPQAGSKGTVWSCSFLFAPLALMGS